MPRFSINVSFMLHEYAFLDRFQAAADLGFAAIDIQLPYEHEPEAISARARAAGVQVVLHNLSMGDRAAGEIGIAGLPGRREEFRAGVAQALDYTRALGNRRVNVLAGVVPPGEAAERCRAVANIIKASAGEASMMARCTGKTKLHNLEPEDLRALTLATADATDIVLAGLR